MELDSYMKNIVSTTVGSVIPRNTDICKKKKSIKQIKEDVYDLLDVEEIIEEFRKSYTSKLQEYVNLINKLENVEKKRVNKMLADLKFITKEIAMKQLINSNLEGLASYLARLKVTFLTKDMVIAKKILIKFTKQKDMNLYYVKDEIEDFSSKLDQLEKVYMKFIHTINSISRSLEHRVLLNHDGVHKIDSMRVLVAKQSEMLYHIRCTFIELCNELKDKECKKLLKDFDL
ncbi:hypothetical protein KY328_05520 [Candidatus Woesearchaeota archaeon]|nr:hypothetical protein [Candidatus Woesearchaeota archaeon]